VDDPTVLSDGSRRGDEVEDDHSRTKGMGQVSSHPKGFLRRLVEIRRMYDRLEELHDAPPSSDFGRG
jgi:hypothetical protein